MVVAAVVVMGVLNSTGTEKAMSEGPGQRRDESASGRFRSE